MKAYLIKVIAGLAAVATPSFVFAVTTCCVVGAACCSGNMPCCP